MSPVRRFLVSDLASLYHEDNTLGKTVSTFRIVSLFKAGPKGPCKNLPETSSNRTHKSLDSLITGGIALAVDKFNQKLAL